MYIVESECIYCGACVVECPESAIKPHPTLSLERRGQGPEHSPNEEERGNLLYAINSDICTHCPDQDVPLCYSICPMNCIEL